MPRIYLIGGILAALLALYLVRGILEAGAKRQEAIAHKIEIRRSNPLIRHRWRERRNAALASGQQFTEAEPSDDMETVEVELEPGKSKVIEPGILVTLKQ